MRMTAAVMFEQGRPAPYEQSHPFSIEEVELDGPHDGEVLVEVRAGGLCHSDLSVVAGLRPRSVPVVGGHEGAGVVREVGLGVTRFQPGDHVVMTGAQGCGHCRMCGENQQNLCETVGTARASGGVGDGSRRLSYSGGQLNHYSGISSFAQYAITAPDSLIKIDPDVPLEVAALFGCAVVTGAGAVFNTAAVRPGQSVAVIGLGGVGLNSVMAARISGASQIIGIDVVASKMHLARELGCTETFLATDPEVIEAVRDLTDGGVDFVFEVSGHRDAMSMATDITRKGADIVCVGLGGLGDLYEYSHARLVLEQKSFRGTFMGGGNAAGDIPRYVRFYQEGRMPVDKLMSGTMSFSDLNRGLDLLAEGTVTREVLLPHGSAN
jgi:Zn-dependent alcohol dehydrogenase